MTETFNHDRFAGAIGAKFTLIGDTGSVDIELTEVTELRERPGAEAFSIYFFVPAGYNVEQGLYRLENEQFGPTDMFLVPVGPEREGIKLEAVFNLLKRDDPTPNG